MSLPCDCYSCDRCRHPATRVLIDAKGRVRLSCRFHYGFTDFDYTREEQVLPVPFDQLSPEMLREWKAGERAWQCSLRKKLRRLEEFLAASEARVSGGPVVPREADPLQRELVLG